MLDREPALVDLAVVVATQCHQVRQVGASAMRPVLDVVGVHAPTCATPREATAAVAGVERPAQRCRDGSRLSPQRQRPAGALDHRHQAGVAGQAPRSLRRQRRAVLGLAATGGVIGHEHLRVDVDDHLEALCAAGVRRAVGERGLGQRGQRIGVRGTPPLSTRVRPGVVGRRLAFRCLHHEALARHLQRLDQKRSVVGRKPAAEDERPVVVMGEAEESLAVGPVALRRQHAAVAAHDAFELG
jgi:hypothetical protein